MLGFKKVCDSLWIKIPLTPAKITSTTAEKEVCVCVAICTINLCRKPEAGAREGLLQKLDSEVQGEMEIETEEF